MKLSHKIYLALLAMFATAQITHAQAVTQAWATLASGSQPATIAIDASGNVYTANYNNNTVSKITSGGTVTKAWATLANNAYPQSIAIDGSGNVYTANNNNNTVSKVTSGGSVTQAWATLANNAFPYAIAIDGSGNVYTANTGNNTVSKITSGGSVTQTWATLDPYAYAQSIAIDGSGNVYTANYGNNTVSKITSGGSVTQAWATLASDAYPYGIAIDGSGNVYTANNNNNTVSKITSGGTVTQTWATLDPYAYPQSIAIDGSGNVYTANYGYNYNTVSKITSGGTVTQPWATLANNANPYGIAIDGSGNVYTANYVNNTVSKISANTWTGATSNAWATATNWNYGTVPSATDNVIIPSTTNKPTISVAGAVAGKITIQNGGILTLTSPGTLTASAGGITVNAGGYLVGNSSNITGSVTLQQSIIAQRGWRVFSNPFSTAQTLSTVASNNAISIQTTGSSNAAGIADDRTFSNSTNTWSDGGTSIAANTPYALFIRGLASEVTGLTYTGGPTAFTYNVSGTLNGATTSVTPANTANFLLVGNPYAAPVNSQALTGQTAGTNYYVYSISQGGNQTAQRTNAGSWVAAGSSSNTTNTIPVLGIIAYKPASTSAFNITPSDINTSGTVQTGLFGVQTPQQQIELQVEQNGDFRDKLFVRLDPNATAAGTEKADLQKFYNDNVNVYTINKEDNTRMAIDARNVLNTIPLGISGLAGDYTFKLSSNNLPEGTTVFIKDKLLNTQTELKVGEVYPFSITSDASTMGEQRFELVFSSKNIATLTDPGTGSLKAAVIGNIIQGNTIALQIAGAAASVNVLVKDISGKAISTAKANNGIQYINIGNTVSGMILLQISDGKSTVIQKVMKL